MILILSTRTSLVFSFLDRYASLAVGIASSLILARVLKPHELGAFSVAMALLALTATVRDFGAGQYLLQEKDLTPDRIRAVWSVQLGLGIALAAIVALASVPAAAFYDEPAMRDIMLLLAVNYLINPFGSVTYAWLMREMRYDAIAVIRFSSTIVTASVSIWFALHEHGAISLAWGSLSGTLTNAAMATLFRPKDYPWMPGRREIRRVLSFGTKITSTSILNTLSTNTPDFFLGKLQGLTSAGLYSRSNGLVAMFHRLVADSVSTVAQSLFARNRRLVGSFHMEFLRATSYVTVIGWSFTACLALLAHPLTRLLYGSQWDDSVDLTRMLAFAMFCSTPSLLCYHALLACGAAKKLLIAVSINTVTVIFLAGFGSFFGLLSLGIGIAMASTIASVVWLKLTRSELHFEWQTLRSELFRCACVTSLTALPAAVAFLAWGSAPSQQLMPLALGAVGGAILFVAGLRLFHHPLLFELIIVRNRIFRRPAGGAE